MWRSPKTIAFVWRELPHWEVEYGQYFVTVDLDGAIAKNIREKICHIRKRLDAHKENRWLAIQRRVFTEMENWLHRADGVRFLADPRISEMLQEAIYYRNQTHIWHMKAYVIMPNHLHLFFGLGPAHHLIPVMDSFKQWTGRQANKVLGRSGRSFWQREWFDHWSRSSEEDTRIIDYIRANPVKAGLVQDSQLWIPSNWNDPRFKRENR